MARFFLRPDNEVRRRYGIPQEKPLVVFLGVLNEYQGVDLLLSAASIMKERIIGVHFLLMGYPDAAYRSMAAEMGLADMITFTGRIDYDQAPYFLSAGDLAVSPKLSRTEANGKILNYMACALPTVVFDTEVNRELLGDTGVYAAYGSAADLAQKIMELLADPERLKMLSGRVREKAEREHSWAARGALIKNVYKQLLDIR
jgi:glycosyltransferase involved in cell wall biosynthesis